MIDLTAAWKEIARFQETGITTTAHVCASDRENALVHEFLEKIPIATLLACLQDASDNGSEKQVVHKYSVIKKYNILTSALNCNRVIGSKDQGNSLFFSPDVRMCRCIIILISHIVPFALAGLSHVEKNARVLVLNQFVTHLSRKPSSDQVNAVVKSFWGGLFSE
ncbi:hypothetical protein PsorP6_002637 [Peronosclerospora sorghi]|uniref:Uncharacterized protein n=1 Tax=Peronosclerospora sorghi TaxID=230839 RepID=A0ACC0WPR5_9STRA|nr:hypothetical protein PsorP6_002637 [Peronosclerospora sorghi]